MVVLKSSPLAESLRREREELDRIMHAATEEEDRKLVAMVMQEAQQEAQKNRNGAQRKARGSLPAL